MPTGYTAPVEEGTITELKDFATQCARAFGAFIHQRDDSMSASLRYPKPPSDGYYKDYLRSAKREYDRWTSLSEEERYAEWSEYANKMTPDLHAAMAKRALKRSRYEAMLAKVSSVDVPSDLLGFKEFMVRQLTESIRIDCGGETSLERLYRVEDFPVWCELRAKQLSRRVDYYTEQVEAEQRRYEEAVAFIDQLAETYGIEVER